jgi:two-component system response regulator (stage 0 sporulation protein A)
MTKELYPMIGLKYDCSGMSVERSMRTAIRIAVERGNSKTLGNLFGHTISIYKDNPTNSEFISIIAEKLRLQMFEMQSVA